MTQYDTEAQDTPKASPFDVLRYRFLINIKQEDCIELLDLIDDDAVERTGHNHLFDSIRGDMDSCAEVLMDWYRAVVFHGHEEEIEIPDEYATALDMVYDYEYTIEDVEVLLNIYQDFLIRAELYEVIPSINNARSFCAMIREQLQKWERDGWDRNRILEKLGETERDGRIIS